MRGISLLFPITILLALAGCATGPGLQSRMVAYTGASGEKLVQNLGVPDKQVTLNGVQYLAYIRQSTEVESDAPLFAGFGVGGGFGGGFGRFGGPFGGGIYDSPLPASVTVWRCETTFTLQADRVVGVTLRGNDCS